MPATAHAAPPSQSAVLESGLERWMKRVLTECDKVAHDFAPDPVHDLRVALRRCRSMAGALMMVDPDKRWKQMRKAPRPLFRKLGELRDVQIMAEWVHRLGPAEDPVTQKLLAYTQAEERRLKSESLTELQAFDLGQWKAFTRSLPVRAHRLATAGRIFRNLALEAWSGAHQLHRAALRNRSKTALHNLRIGLKKLRYLTENFLPDLHQSWGGDLKYLQDTLGEVHDLDVLWEAATRLRVFPDAAVRRQWHALLAAERSQRIEKYRQKMVGPHSLWPRWRAALPQGEEAESGAMERLRTWASLLDREFAHARRVSLLALQLYDGLSAQVTDPSAQDPRSRRLLHAAALMHNVGTSRQNRNHHKRSYKLIHELHPPFGWSLEDIHLAAHVARYHRGALPAMDQKGFAQLTSVQQAQVVFLAGILRLADGIDRQYAGSIRRLKIEAGAGFVTVWAEGQVSCDPQSERVAAARYLVESACQQPVFVRHRVLLPARRSTSLRVVRPRQNP